MNLILHPRENLAKMLHGSSQSLRRLSKKLHERQNSASQPSASDSNAEFDGPIGRAGLSFWNRESPCYPGSGKKAANITASDLRPILDSPGSSRLQLPLDDMNNHLHPSAEVKASGGSLEIVNRSNTVAIMKEHNLKYPPIAKKVDQGRKSSRGAADQTETEAQAYLATVNPKTHPASPPIPLQGPNRDLPVIVSNAQP